MAERVALNLLQRMCGIATLTSLYVQAVSGTKARIVDTRKTTPGLREVEKYAVRVGAALIIAPASMTECSSRKTIFAAAGGITEAVSRARAYIPHTLKIEIETRNARTG